MIKVTNWIMINILIHNFTFYFEPSSSSFCCSTDNLRLCATACFVLALGSQALELSSNVATFWVAGWPALSRPLASHMLQQSCLCLPLLWWLVLLASLSLGPWLLSFWALGACSQESSKLLVRIACLCVGSKLLVAASVQVSSVWRSSQASISDFWEREPIDLMQPSLS